MALNLLKRPRPGIADVECRRLRFEPGDRVLVRLYHKIDGDQERKLRRAIQKWAGCEVEVFFINCLQMDLEILKGVSDDRG